MSHSISDDACEWMFVVIDIRRWPCRGGEEETGDTSCKLTLRLNHVFSCRRPPHPPKISYQPIIVDCSLDLHSLLLQKKISVVLSPIMEQNATSSAFDRRFCLVKATFKIALVCFSVCGCGIINWITETNKRYSDDMLLGAGWLSIIYRSSNSLIFVYLLLIVYLCFF